MNYTSLNEIQFLQVQNKLWNKLPRVLSECNIVASKVLDLLLVGSFANGHADAQSDLDFVFYCTPDLHSKDIWKKTLNSSVNHLFLQPADTIIGKKVDCMIRTQHSLYYPKWHDQADDKTLAYSPKFKKSFNLIEDVVSFYGT